MKKLNNVVWSHSSLNCIMNNPSEYFLNYIEGIKPKTEKTALSIGSAVHWGLEHNTSDLSDYYNEKGNFKQWNNYTDEQLLAECIVEAYLKRKPEIYKEILKDYETNSQLTLLEEYKELVLTCKVPSKLYEEGHEFLGILDLLLYTNKGFILIDYKTGSQEVDYDEYKSQLFKYIEEINYNFPDIPIYKVGVIYLKKTGIKRKRNENDFSYRNRIKMEYELNEENLIQFHDYKRSEFNDIQLKNYINDLSEMMDTAQLIRDNKLYFVNYSNIKTQWGKSQYYDIFYKTKDNYLLYIIKDKIYDDFENKLLDYRDCEPIDMLSLENKNILNKYETFKKVTDDIILEGINTKDKLFEKLKKDFICSDKLLDIYFDTYNKGY